MNTQIANTILNQLGGMRFSVMTGAKNFIAIDSGVTFKIGRNAHSVNHVTVIFDAASDLYNIKFEKVRVKKDGTVDRKVIAEHLQVYNDQLRDLFTQATGMYTSL